MSRTFIATWILLAAASCLGGCRATTEPVELPHRERMIKDQLVVYTNFKLPRRHRLLEDLTNNRRVMTEVLALPDSDEPIHVFLFRDERRYRSYLRRFLPNLPDRRAFFIKNDTELRVFAHWGDRIAEDLRHEVAHGYLHSVVTDIPLWLDEGLAEYFEVSRSRRGLNRTHVHSLVHKFRRGNWRPNLKRLEKLKDAGSLTQDDYAEAWLWTHFLLNSEPAHRQLVRDQLARIRMAGDVTPLSEHIEGSIKNVDEAVLRHLRQVAKDID